MDSDASMGRRTYQTTRRVTTQMQPNDRLASVLPALEWALRYVRSELVAQHQPEDPFETCRSPQCQRYREVSELLRRCHVEAQEAPPARTAPPSHNTET